MRLWDGTPTWGHFACRFTVRGEKLVAHGEGRAVLSPCDEAASSGFTGRSRVPDGAGCARVAAGRWTEAGAGRLGVRFMRCQGTTPGGGRELTLLAGPSSSNSNLPHADYLRGYDYAPGGFGQPPTHGLHGSISCSRFDPDSGVAPRCLPRPNKWEIVMTLSGDRDFEVMSSTTALPAVFARRRV